MSGRLEMTLLINQISLEDSAQFCRNKNKLLPWREKTLYSMVGHHPHK